MQDEHQQSQWRNGASGGPVALAPVGREDARRTTRAAGPPSEDRRVETPEG